jgi:hypothetical protein
MSDVLPRLIVSRQIERLMEICDGSNWPEYAQSGDGYKAYSEIAEQLLEVIMNLQAAR